MKDLPWWGRLPPPFLTLCCLILIYAVQRWTGRDFLMPALVPSALLLLALVCGVGGLWRFHRAGTTHDPMRPERVSALVTGGVYRLTRNPMYLAQVQIALAYGLHSGRWLALLPVALLFWHLNRYQIPREEAVLSERFGDDFARYCQRVNRWLGRRSGN